MKGTKPMLRTDKAAVDVVPRAPAWLSKDAKLEWRRIMPLLVERRILTEADMGSVESYCVATGRVREIERLIQLAAGDIDPKLFRMQDKAMQTGRQLTPPSRFTPTAPPRRTRPWPRRWESTSRTA